MRPLIKRIRWVKIGCILCGILAAGAVGYSCYMDSLATELVEYRAIVEEGETLWGIVAKVATDKEERSRHEYNCRELQSQATRRPVPPAAGINCRRV